jgi:hypothetical protein
MRTIVRIKFGSHLYGTNTPQSDLDYKSVFVPSARDILLQRVPGSISSKRAKGHREKNHAGEIDEEGYSLQRFLGLAAEGQTVALDLLFAPPASMIGEPHSEWLEVTRNRHRLITRKSAAFVEYCRQQANKYGIKGSRVAASRKALYLLIGATERLGTTARLAEIAPEIQLLLAGTPHMSLASIELPNGDKIDHWEVCGRKMPFSASIKYARDVMQRLVNEYGSRAIRAERNEGIDWKALSHAVRVGQQALELLRTGQITFPLTNAAEIRAIKLGERSYQQVSEQIEALLEEVEAAAARSLLRDQPDYEWINDFVERVHQSAVEGEAQGYECQ